MRVLKARGIREELEYYHNQTEKRFDEISLRFDEFLRRFDRSEADWKEERREMEAHIAADRRETAERLAQDRRDAEARLERDRKDAEMRLERESREFKAQKRWLVANFVAVVAGIGGIFAAIVILML